MNNFVIRVLFVLVSVPLLFALILFVPFMNHLPVVVLLFLFTAGSSLEMRRMVEPAARKSRDVSALILGVLPSLATFLARLAWPDASLAVSWAAPVMASITTAFLVTALPLALPPRPDSSIPETVHRASANALYLFYPGVLASAMIAMLGAPENAGLIVVWFALIVFGNDSLAWLAGVTLGKKRGIFAVSPKKSLEGLIAGLAGSLLVAFAGPLICPSAIPRNWPLLALVGIACGVSGVIGDLFESAIKRSAGIKDSGTIIPGRGGILDSYDSLLFTAPVFAGILAIAGILV